MEYGFIVTLAIVVLIVAGFVFLAATALRNWTARSRGKEAVDAEQSARTADFERCFNECMASEHWDPDKEEMCKGRCHS